MSETQTEWSSFTIPFEPSVSAKSYTHSEPASETPSIQIKTHTMHTQSLSQKVLHLETNETQSSMEHSEEKDSAVEPNIGITYQGGASYI
jgi:hypothetical protein